MQENNPLSKYMTSGLSQDNPLSKYTTSQPSGLEKFKTGVSSYFKEAQPAFKFAVRHPYELMTGTAGNLPPEEFQERPWGDIVTKEAFGGNFPGAKSTSMWGTIWPQLAGETLEFATRPSTYLLPTALGKLGKTFAGSELGQKFLRSQTPTIGKQFGWIKPTQQEVDTAVTGVLNKFQVPKDLEQPIAVKEIKPLYTRERALNVPEELRQRLPSSVRTEPSVSGLPPHIESIIPERVLGKEPIKPIQEIAKERIEKRPAIFKKEEIAPTAKGGEVLKVASIVDKNKEVLKILARKDIGGIEKHDLLAKLLAERVAKQPTILNDINTALGKKGMAGLHDLTPEQIAARERLKALAREQGKDLATFLTEQGVDKQIINTLTAESAKITGKILSKINLEKYPEDTRGAIEKIITEKPELIERKVISHAQLQQMAEKIDNTVLSKKILSMPEGQLAAEALKLRQGEDAIIRNLLKEDTDDLVNKIKTVLSERQTSAVGKMGTELGRALEQQKINIQPQQEIADLINQRITKYRNDPSIARLDKRVMVNSLLDLRQKTLTKDFNPSWFDKSYELWINSILSGLGTHTANIVGNTLFAGVKPFEKFVSALIDIPVSKLLKKGKRTHYFSEIPAQLKGLGRFAKGEKLPIESPSITKFDVSYPGAIKGVKGKIIRFPTKALTWEDNFSKNMVGWMELQGRATATAKQEGLKGTELTKRIEQLISNSTDKLTGEVNKEQLIRTFQDMTALGDVVTNLPQKFLRWILPFRRSLSSIISKGLERNPLGIVKVAVRTRKMKQGIPYPQEEFVSDLANATIGTGIGVGLIYGILKGRITGAPPEDKAKRDLFYAQGKQPYSIKIDNKWVPFNRLEPYGTAAMFMTDTIKGFIDSDKDIFEGKLLDSIMSMTKSLASKTFLSGITNFVNAAVNPEQYSEKFLGQLTTGFVPFSGALRNVRQITDSTVREPKGILERVKEPIPFLSKTVPPKISSLGKEVKREPVGVSRYTPFPITEEKKDIVVDELVRLDKSIGYPSKKLTSYFKTKDKQEITREDYSRLLRGTSSAILNVLSNMINYTDYRYQPDEIKIRRIDAIMSAIKAQGISELKREKKFF